MYVLHYEESITEAGKRTLDIYIRFEMGLQHNVSLPHYCINYTTIPDSTYHCTTQLISYHYRNSYIPHISISPSYCSLMPC